MAAGGRGLVFWPGRASEFRDSVQLAAAIGAELGYRTFNAPHRDREDNVSPDWQDGVALENLVYAADVVAGIGGTVRVEAITRPLSAARGGEQALIVKPLARWPMSSSLDSGLSCMTRILAP
jgi:hydroxypyruvate isomerase